MAKLTFDWKLKGMTDLNARLNELATTEATKAGQSAVRAGATAALKAMKDSGAIPVSNVPEGAIGHRTRKSGKQVEEAHHKIIDNLKVTKTKPDTQTAVGTAITVGKAWTARFPEFGTIHQAPQHWMLKSFADQQQIAIDAMLNALNKQLLKRGQ